MKLVVVEPQPEFPFADISDSSAEMLELLLQNHTIFEAHHTSAEQAWYLYQLGHKSLDAVAMSRLKDGERHDAFSYGVATYEAIAAMVRPQLSESNDDKGPQDEQLQSTHKTVLQVMTAQQVLMDGFTTAVGDARERFDAELPRTTQLIGASAARFYPGYTDYAISGAATARSLEINTWN